MNPILFRLRLASVTILLLFVSGCKPTSSPQIEGGKSSAEKVQRAKPLVHTSNYPLYYFANRLSAGFFEVVCLPMQAEGDPAFWKPTGSDIVAMQSADLILFNGADYEKWVSVVSLPAENIVSTAGGFRDSWITTAKGVAHRHGDGEKHSHGETAFTTWLDFSLAAKQVERVSEGLIQLQPDKREEILKRRELLLIDLKALDQQMKALGEKLRSTDLVASHPVYDYLAAAYGLNMRAVHWEPEQALTEEDEQELKKLRRNADFDHFIWEGTPVPASVETLKNMGIGSFVFDPCGAQPDEGDFLSVMNQNIEQLRRILRGDEG